jgi:hypothetical protein
MAFEMELTVFVKPDGLDMGHFFGVVHEIFPSFLNWNRSI